MKWGLYSAVFIIVNLLSWLAWQDYQELKEKQVSRSQVIAATDEAYTQMRDLYYQTDKLTSETIIDQSLEAMFDKTDKHSGYHMPKDSKEIMAQISGFRGNFGIMYRLFKERDNGYYIIRTFPNSPAHKAGLRSGDQLISVNNELIDSEDNTPQKLFPKADKDTVIVIEREVKGKKQSLSFTINRGEYYTPSIDPVHDFSGIPYIRMHRFSDKSEEEFLHALNQAHKIHPSLAILDLRENGGGSLDSTIAICENFLFKGETILSTVSRKKKEYTYSSKTGDFRQQKFIILVNENSASASELLSAFLRDHDKAILIGQKTYGKGSIQKLYKMQRHKGGLIRITHGQYFSPKDYPIHEVGLSVDYSIKLEEDEQKQCDDFLDYFGTAFQDEKLDPQTQAAIDFALAYQKEKKDTKIKQALDKYLDSIKISK